MKLFKLIAFCVVCFVLQSCGKFADGTSVWQEGLWILPLLTFAGFVIFAVLAFKDWKSGSVVDDKHGNPIPSKKKLKWYNNGYAWFAIFCLVAFIGIIIWVNADK
jgi:hypothetical protein